METRKGIFRDALIFIHAISFLLVSTIAPTICLSICFRVSHILRPKKGVKPTKSAGNGASPFECLTFPAYRGPVRSFFTLP